MKLQRAFKYELRPNGQQAQDMKGFAGSCRFVYNKALALQKSWYATDNTIRFSYNKLANLLPIWKQELPWLKLAPSHILQQSIKNLGTAYMGFFAKRTDFPNFKCKGRCRESFRYPDSKQIKLDESNDRIFLPKLGWMRYRNSRKIEGDVRNVTVSLKAGKWFVSIQTEREIEKPVCNSEKAVGIDLGITRFATLSDGTVYPPLNSFKRHETALRKSQQALSRKKKFSKNWHKALHEVRRLHATIANVRMDFLHKSSTTIRKNHAVVVLEDLQIRNMSKSAKGSMDAPGRNVKAKSGLNKSILNQGWFMFRTLLDYKLVEYGSRLILVPPHHTSQTCPECGHVSKENRKTQANFVCVSCGYAENADLVAACNILRAGLARLACEVNPEVKDQQQEPTEVIQPGSSGSDAVGIVCL